MRLPVREVGTSLIAGGPPSGAEGPQRTAREDERRRLRRDLHDGLGPILTASAVRVQVARRLLRRDPEAADAVLAETAEAIAAAVDELRRVVDDLRPRPLERLGLVGALEAQASKLAGSGTGDDEEEGLRVAVRASGDLRSLPATVEVGAYRIISEAMHNASRHAGAQACTVRLQRRRELEIEVADDGAGLAEPPGAHAVGMRSMHERATELGGTLVIESTPGRGTRVRARLPLGAGAGSAA